MFLYFPISFSSSMNRQWRLSYCSTFVLIFHHVCIVYIYVFLPQVRLAYLFPTTLASKFLAISWLGYIAFSRLYSLPPLFCYGSLVILTLPG